MLSTFCPQGLAFALKSEQLNYWLREKPLEMRIVLDRFCSANIRRASATFPLVLSSLGRPRVDDALTVVPQRTASPSL
jgi:hypothetical protein